MVVETMKFDERDKVDVAIADHWREGAEIVD